MNFIIFGIDTELYKISYNDVFGKENIRYVSQPPYPKGSLINLLYRVHHSPRINNKVLLPYKSIWNHKIFQNPFSTESDIIFVFLARQYMYFGHNFFLYLRKSYPKSKFVCVFSDLVSKHCGLNIDKVQQDFDLVLSFDHNDVQRYNMIYYPLVYSYIEIPTNHNIKPSDVYFLGAAKDRLDAIIDCYEKIRGSNLKCDFHIVGVPRSKQTYKDEINYCHGMNYLENLQRINATKCLLEVVQSGGYGYTLRTCEAITYNKKLLTGNRMVLKAPFYQSEYISVFDKASNIDAAAFINQDTLHINYQYKNQLSPLKMLDFIRNYFEVNGD